MFVRGAWAERGWEGCHVVSWSASSPGEGRVLWRRCFRRCRRLVLLPKQDGRQQRGGTAMPRVCVGGRCGPTLL